MFPRTAAIVGAGASGLLHGLAYRAHGVEIVGVHDVDPRRAHDLAGILGARHVLGSIDEVASADVGCVSICSPPRVHVAQAERCAARGRAVFVEKPVATEADELVRLAALPGVVPIVQWRRGRALDAVRRAIAAGELGPAPSVAVDLAWNRDAAYFARGRGSRATWGCGAILSIGVHALDAICWALASEPVDVRGFVERRPGFDIETRAAVALRFRSDAIGRAAAMGTFHVTLDAGPDRTTLVFAGNGVTARIEGGEADPTAGEVAWHAIDGAARRRLEAIERESAGDLHGPLVVPFVGSALEALRRGEAPGESATLPSIADVRAGHDAAMRAAAL